VGNSYFQTTAGKAKQTAANIVADKNRRKNVLFF
jgi:hypothetical protein